MMRAISLFSGVGGFDMGLDAAGIETVLQVEIDPWCQAVLARHWPSTERLADVRDLCQAHAPPRQGRCRDLERERSSSGAERLGDEAHSPTTLGRTNAPRELAEQQQPDDRSFNVDLIYGGFPCQDVSVAGNREGLAGERSGLWREFHRVLSELRPAWTVIGNVPGLRSSERGRDLAVVLGGLEELGYGWAYRTVDARYAGVAQRRARVFIAGHLGDSLSPAAVLAVCEGCAGHPTKGREARQSVAGNIAAGAHPSGFNGQDAYNGHLIEGMNLPCADTLSVGANQTTGFIGEAVVVPRGLTSRNFGVRRLTPLECERLMGWPDEWTRWTVDGREVPDSVRYRMAGNGVVGFVAEWIARRLVAVAR